MKKITRFEDKKITIDGIVGTIYRTTETGFCEFVYRNDGVINSIRVAATYLKAISECSYKIREQFSVINDRHKQTHYPSIEHWSGCYPCGEYIMRDESLTKAGI